MLGSMRNKLGVGLTVSLLAVGISSTNRSGAANAVQKTADNCVSAHAVLMVSADGDHNRYWEAIARVIRSPLHWWRVVDEPEPMVAQTFSLRQYDLRFDEGTAYVAHCGAGFTCNKLAEEVLKSFPDSGSPKVYCGPIPHVLDNPQSPTVNIETPAGAAP
jgi:hypothetical protein